MADCETCGGECVVKALNGTIRCERCGGTGEMPREQLEAIAARTEAIHRTMIDVDKDKHSTTEG